MFSSDRKLAVVAIGGNALIKDASHMTVEDQYAAICETVEHILALIDHGLDVVITHGNGPQVGFIMRRSEIAEAAEHLHPVPLVSCDADTQGAIGYQLQQALQNAFKKRDMNNNAVTLVTQVAVDINDPAFKQPTKPIGSFYPEAEVKAIGEKHPDWQLVKDDARGYRRVVPSPKPIRIIELDAIKTLIKAHFTVIAVGGGGIPVIDQDGILTGVNAVIDKDLASALLAVSLKADYLIIATGVDKVCLDYGKPDQKCLCHLDLAHLKFYASEGHFGAGSMLPKVLSAQYFVERGGNKAFITSSEFMLDAVKGLEGTVITK